MQEDHPRSRGVYRYRKKPIEIEAGSSPLARGLRVGLAGIPGRRRIIPARAGFTHGAVMRILMAADHPRSRGVYPTVAELNKGLHGSSPLARGLLGSRMVTPLVTRIIPARAGFTTTMAVSTRARADHPRSRGVYSRSLSDDAFTGGSSPLARGLPRRVLRTTRSRGIIPARAGFTHPCCSSP